jgi:beta-glucosidase
VSAGVAGRAAIDLQREANGQLSLGFDYSLEKPVKSAVVLAMECGAGCKGALPMTHELQTTAAGQWRHLKIPLACFAKAGADMTRITAPFVITTAGEFELAVGNIRLETGTDGLLSCTL